MTLSENELTELAVVELHADLPLEEIRKRTKHHSHTIRYNLKKLEDRGVISKAPFIDVYPLGYTAHAVVDLLPNNLMPAKCHIRLQTIFENFEVALPLLQFPQTVFARI